MRRSTLVERRLVSNGAGEENCGSWQLTVRLSDVAHTSAMIQKSDQISTHERTGDIRTWPLLRLDLGLRGLDPTALIL